MNLKKNYLIALVPLVMMFVLFGCGKVLNHNSSTSDSSIENNQSANLVSQSILSGDETEYAENQVIVKLKSGIQVASAMSVMSSIQASSIKKITSQVNPNVSIEVWSVQGQTVDDAVSTLRSDPFVEFAEPNYRYQLLNTPNDPSLSSLWGLHNTGQSGGTNDADIGAVEAWGIQTGNDVVIAVIDTGVDYNHNDLKNNLWINTDEIPGNGIDDDNNGYIDDDKGWDFSDRDRDPSDYHSHGTHVSGTIAAEGNNAVGVVGVNWKAKIMPVKIFPNAYADIIYEAIIYAVDNGAKISNNSWGSGGYSQTIESAIEYAKNNGHLFIAAAGNYSRNNDANPFYPASYTLDNIVSVAATDHHDGLASFSHYGATSVDLGAPGVSIYSSVLSNSYGYKSGTSTAAPHVAGVAGLLLSHNASLSYSQIKDALLNNVDEKSSLQGKVVSNGRLNAHKALLSLGVSDPGNPDNLTINSSTEKQSEYRANISITAGGGFTVLGSETIEFSAGQKIDINSNFDVQPGASFDAVIE